MYSIRRTTDREAVLSLHRDCFGPTIELDGDEWWLVWEKGKNYPVGFASGRESTAPEFYFLARAGVLPEARGKGLQRRLIRIRVKHARSQGYKGVLTYAANYNSPSIINLLKEGFELYDPAHWMPRAKRWRTAKRDGFAYFLLKF